MHVHLEKNMGKNIQHLVATFARKKMEKKSDRQTGEKMEEKWGKKSREKIKKKIYCY